MISPGIVARAQVMSLLNITEAIGEALHRAGKLHTHNTYVHCSAFPVGIRFQ